MTDNTKDLNNMLDNAALHSTMIAPSFFKIARHAKTEQEINKALIEIDSFIGEAYQIQKDYPSRKNNLELRSLKLAKSSLKSALRCIKLNEEKASNKPKKAEKIVLDVNTLELLVKGIVAMQQARAKTINAAIPIDTTQKHVNLITGDAVADSSIASIQAKMQAGQTLDQIANDAKINAVDTDKQLLNDLKQPIADVPAIDELFKPDENGEVEL